MGNWTYSDDYTLLPNLYVRSRFKDGELKYYQIYPCSGYVLHIPSGDMPAFDEYGNEIYDEDGNLVIEQPYYTWGGATALVGYDFTTNPSGFEAVPYEESMTVFGTVNPPTEIM